MVFNLSDIDVEGMQFAVGKHQEHIKQVTDRYFEKKKAGECTCPIKIETRNMKKFLKNLEKEKKGLMYKRRHDNGYDIGRPKCPVHDLIVKTIDPNQYED